MATRDLNSQKLNALPRQPPQRELGDGREVRSSKPVRAENKMVDGRLSHLASSHREQNVGRKAESVKAVLTENSVELSSTHYYATTTHLASYPIGTGGLEQSGSGQEGQENLELYIQCPTSLIGLMLNYLSAGKN
jgi:hypothetical protein